MRVKISSQLRGAARRVRLFAIRTRERWRGVRARTRHATCPPRVVMTLLVRDEADIVAATIEHALAAGVDFIVATDNGSIDGTIEILEAYKSAGVLDLIHEPDRTYEQGRWVTRMAQIAASRHRAGWVINADADEFVCPLDLASAWTLPGLLGSIDPRCGMVGLDRLDHYADPTANGQWADIFILRHPAPLPPQQISGVWKVMHRADPHVVVEQGNHYAHGPLIGTVAPARPFAVRHFPDRGYEHYERKIRNGGSAYIANPRFDATMGVHWRRDFALLQAGELQTAYASRRHSPSQVEQALASGELVRDTTLRDRLVALIDRAIRPDLLRQALGR